MIHQIVRGARFQALFELRSTQPIRRLRSALAKCSRAAVAAGYELLAVFGALVAFRSTKTGHHPVAQGQPGLTRGAARCGQRVAKPRAQVVRACILLACRAFRGGDGTAVGPAILLRPSRAAKRARAAAAAATTACLSSGAAVTSGSAAAADSAATDSAYSAATDSAASAAAAADSTASAAAAADSAATDSAYSAATDSAATDSAYSAATDSALLRRH